MNGEILVFTRMPAVGFDAFMADPEAVIATVEDMGFDQGEMLSSMTYSGDPSQLVKLMEGRWSGEEMNFSFESYWPILLEKFPQNSLLKMIKEEGRRSKIFTDFGEIFVLNPAQVRRAHEGLEAMQLVELNSYNEEEFMLEDLFCGLKRFFYHAFEAGEFVLVSNI